MLAGVGVFCAGSVLCAMAPNAPVLIARRAVMGVGAAASEPGTLSMLRHMYSGERTRDRAVGLWTAVCGLALAMGPVIGGALVGIWDWRAIVWFNLAFGAAALALGAAVLPESADPDAHRVDMAGAASPGIHGVTLAGRSGSQGRTTHRVAEEVFRPGRAACGGGGRRHTGVLAISGPLPAASAATVPPGLAGRNWTAISINAKVVTLTFDAGANADGVPSILGTLARYHVPGTFFLTGNFVRDFPAAAKAIAAAGYRIGDHSVTHQCFIKDKLTDAQIRDQVLTAQSQIKSVTGADPWPWFCFPYGDYNQHTISVVNGAGFVPVGWTVDTLGWEGTSGGITTQTVLNRVLGSLQPGKVTNARRLRTVRPCPAAGRVVIIKDDARVMSAADGRARNRCQAHRAELAPAGSSTEESHGRVLQAHCSRAVVFRECVDLDDLRRHRRHRRRHPAIRVRDLDGGDHRALADHGPRHRRGRAATRKDPATEGATVCE